MIAREAQASTLAPRPSLESLLTEAHGVMVDEAAGESAPVERRRTRKRSAALWLFAGRAYLAPRRRDLRARWASSRPFSGAIEVKKTPLERRLAALGHQVARWVVGTALALTLARLVAEGGRPVRGDHPLCGRGHGRSRCSAGRHASRGYPDARTRCPAHGKETLRSFAG